MGQSIIKDSASPTPEKPRSISQTKIEPRYIPRRPEERVVSVDPDLYTISSRRRIIDYISYLQYKGAEELNILALKIEQIADTLEEPIFAAKRVISVGERPMRASYLSGFILRGYAWINNRVEPINDFTAFLEQYEDKLRAYQLAGSGAQVLLITRDIMYDIVPVRFSYAFTSVSSGVISVALSYVIRSHTIIKHESQRESNRS